MSLPINSLYSLTWGDYGTSLVSAVQLLRCHGDLVDVTLAAGGRSFPAHKIVLCAASPFLLDLLKNTPCKHPVVMLAGVNANDLEALLEFVYRGEVSVDHSQLPSLLQAAHCLNIQGLAPQTVSHKDDNTTYTTSIQLHPTLVPQNHVKAVIDVANNVCTTEELITTLGPTQTVQAQVIETITPDQMSDEVTKDVISQFLPTRKRKQRTKKTGNQGQTGAATNSAGGTQAAKVMKTDDDGTTIQVIVNNPDEAAPVPKDIKKEANADGTTVDTKEGIIKIKSKSQSEQPATCPICQAVIRQSRNLRRHLELRHFKKPGVKKERVRKSKKGQANANQANGSNGTNAGTITVTGDQVAQQAQQQVVQQQQQAQQQQVQQAQQQQQNTIDTTGTISVTVSQAQAQQIEQAAANGQQHVVTQHENADGTTSLSIAQVQTLDGHQLAIGNLNQNDADVDNGEGDVYEIVEGVDYDCIIDSGVDVEIEEETGEVVEQQQQQHQHQQQHGVGAIVLQEDDDGVGGGVGGVGGAMVNHVEEVEEDDDDDVQEIVMDAASVVRQADEMMVGGDVSGDTTDGVIIDATTDDEEELLLHHHHSHHHHHHQLQHSLEVDEDDHHHQQQQHQQPNMSDDHHHHHHQQQQQHHVHHVVEEDDVEELSGVVEELEEEEIVQQFDGSTVVTVTTARGNSSRNAAHHTGGISFVTADLPLSGRRRIVRRTLGSVLQDDVHP
uniref:Uncharacterized protein n=1 Tax=Anopheles stephensi TaxID=30069 RepID=A0A182Y620_ANOST